MTTTRRIKSFEELQGHVYILRRGAGRASDTSVKVSVPKNFDALNALREESADSKIYEDAKLQIELVFALLGDTSSTSKITTASLSAKSGINGCKEYFLKHSVPDLYYVKETSLKELYNDTFREAVIRKLLLEIKNEGSHRFDANILNVINLILNEKENSKWIAEAVYPEISNQQKLKNYIEYGIGNEKIALGLETLDPELIDMGVIKHYDQEVDKIKKKFTLLDNEIEHNRHPVKQKAVTKIVERLKSSNEFVLVSADFLVQKTPENQFYFEFIHPVSEYWGEPVKIVITEIPEQDFEQGYRLQYSKLVGRNKSLNVFGRVFQPIRDGESLDFMITPYAIF